MNPIILHMKYEYHDMIKSGEKTIEYREKKPYWDKRLKDRKEIIFVFGYNLDNIFDIKADILKVDIVEFDDLPDYAKKLFSESDYKEFYAIKFKLFENTGGLY